MNHQPSSNDHMLDFVDAYLHDALEPDQAAQVEEHCETCRICQVALEEARKRFQALSVLPSLEAGEDLLARTEDWLDERIASLEQPPSRTQPSRTGSFRTLRWIAIVFGTAVVLIASLQIYYSNLSLSPYDLQVLGERELLAGVETSLRVMAVDRDKEAPLEDAPVRIELARLDGGDVIELVSFRTDANGTGQPVIRIPEEIQGEYELRVHLETPSGSEQIAQTVQVKRESRVMLSTDKPVYQPGQTIHVRAIALRTIDRKPIAGERAEFRLIDPKDNVVFQHRDVTSRFGITAADCQLAHEILEGDYRIECAIGDTNSAATVEVKSYTLPKYRISADVDRAYYAPGDLLKGTVTCEYFFGQPVVDGEISIEVRTGDAESQFLGSMTRRTDRNGRAAFEYRIPDRLTRWERSEQDATISLSVTVTDSAGQSQSKSLECLITKRPLRLEVIPESGTLVQDLTNDVFLFASYPDGRPAADVRISVSGIDRELITDRFGVCTLQLTPHSQTLNLTLSARDAAGNRTSTDVQLQCEADNNAFVLRVAQPVVDAGEEFQLTVLGGGTQPVFVDFLKDGQLLLTESVHVKDGRGSLAVDLPPELSGTVQVCAYRIADTGLPARKSQTIYVRSSTELQIETIADQTEYRPGGTAKLQFRLRDRRGRPAPGALSLAAVDEAVFSVVSQRHGLEHSFTEEPDLLQPVHEISPWTPLPQAEARADERIQFERALFARTARRNGGGRSEALNELLPFLDNNPMVFEVLDRPDWREIAPDWLGEDLIALVDANDGMHSLQAQTWPAKVQKMESLRRSGQELVDRLFSLFLFAFFVTGLGWVLAVTIKRGHITVVEWLAAGAVVGFLILLMLPTVQQAREAARRSTARNNLHQIGLALHNFHDAHGHFPNAAESENESEAPIRVRTWFPETLLWRPELITDDRGFASLEVPLADSITTWRLTASAVSANGELGGTQSAIRVFQPFFVDLNLPVALTRGDEVTVQAVVYNYLDEPQEVSLQFENADWFELLDDSEKTVNLQPEDVQSVGFRIRVTRVGHQELQVTARGGELTDAIQRSIEVEPDGHPVQQVTNGKLVESAGIDLDVPPAAIEGSPQAIVKIYPSRLSQLAEGLEGIFQMPYGCFEQTSSTTYPNVLALDYMQRTNQNVPAVEVKARKYIHLGYQRLLSFEVSGGGFDWFGDPPANRTLTAYGLMEFEDMARVHDVDPRLIDRTREWLLSERNLDGTWDPESHRMHEDPAQGGNRRYAALRTTAYIGWAVFGGHSNDPNARLTVDALLKWSPDEIENPYDLALVCNALLAIDSARPHAAPYLDRLHELRRMSNDGKQVWWEQSRDSRTMFYGAGTSGNVVTTSLAALAFLSPQLPDAVDRSSRISAHKALDWLSAQRGPYGTWPTTQSTVLALKALIAGTEQSGGGDRDRRILVELDGEPIHEISIPAWKTELVQQIEINRELVTGAHRLKLTDRTGAEPEYQVAFQYHVPEKSPSDSAEPLSLELAYGREELEVDDIVTATATVRNDSGADFPMIVLDLPIPAGFAVDSASFQQMQARGTIDKFQVTPGNVILYLRSLDAKETVFDYTLQAVLPVKTTTKPAVAYEYYNPEVRAESDLRTLIVTGEE